MKSILPSIDELVKQIQLIKNNPRYDGQKINKKAKYHVVKNPYTVPKRFPWYCSTAISQLNDFKTFLTDQITFLQNIVPIRFADKKETFDFCKLGAIKPSMIDINKVNNVTKTIHWIQKHLTRPDLQKFCTFEAYLRKLQDTYYFYIESINQST